MLTLKQLQEMKPNTVFASGQGLIIHPWASKRNDKNQISFIGDVGIFYIKNIRVVFDIEDYDKICGIKWCLHKKGYIVGRRNSENILLHKLILGSCPDGLETDHINQDKGDNRKVNLRFTSRQQNQFNKNLQSNNKSGYRGVSWDKRRKEWRSNIKINGKQIINEYFKNKDDAIKFRKDIEIKYINKQIINVFTTNLQPDGHHVLVNWVAIRGGIHDWAIYHSLDANLEPADCLGGFTHLEATDEQIARSGAKLYREYEIRAFVECDDESFKMYRY
jgi:hypothetical protein